ncbi:radical SAM/SPASM domain-containing protein [Streptomyces niveus]|uniref:radical SAM/SPASM domain-containing protein n=1 Tax=Streptomyces niveus TaxID=193462 RepID=UPI0036B8F57D
MTTVVDALAAPLRLRFLALEITGRCQLTCSSHCYAEAGPTRDHGSMTVDDWLRIIDEAAALGTETVQLIGGEPTLSPGFGRLVEHALAAGLRVRVYSNLFRVSEEHWALFEHPRVRLATSYYSDIAEEHDRITGRTGSHAATRANIAQAVRRGVHVSVGVIDMGGGQRAEQARAEMRALGVDEVGVDKVRAVGNAARGALPSTSSLCGRCGDGKAAILPTGDVTVCELGRFLTAGSVRDASLSAVLASERWADVVASVPRRPGAAPCGPDCSPNDDNCQPSSGGTCGPASEDGLTYDTTEEAKRST